MKSTVIFAAVAALAIGTTTVFAQAGHRGHQGHDATAAPTASAAAAAPSEGTVRKVDLAANKLTIAHGPLENLGMPAMTMVFTVAESVSLDGIAVGDKIRFVADRIDGTFVVMTLAPAS